jgi:hypothetical protein
MVPLKRFLYGAALSPEAAWKDMSLLAPTVIGAGVAGVVGAFFKLRPCNHRFGIPVNDYVCCMKCARRYAIESTPSGEWRIGRRPVGNNPVMMDGGAARR